MSDKYKEARIYIDYLEAELARRDDLIKRLVEDGERVIAMSYGVTKDGEEYYKCPHCGMSGYTEGAIHHRDDCPITLHRALMKELEG